ncbi:sigma-70 family RNA polymerase sigma factor [Anaerobacillus isosaccharinicus]|uniref:RNA polymerase sigma factor n=1 Tax=Anaerobacillus isosaccharinicus TaxID=1532552 RepID=A0A1S2LVC8_9BACI|nr:sigma-70 family RNA polymerase sigma factor [Anaerobacillus isosaccharinicus]MBA5588428.1 sigma-70 family RNA polymerase sigma factor [Anaerobacillus isosaccharinicus]QOY38144.1 sigma-70 family RNA polymerase sigma factor [Anaerobacillus isosaccharinicus]
MGNANDEINQMIDHILSGNKKTFGDLYEKTIQDVYTTIHFLLEDKTEVDDIVQETYIQVYKNLSKFDKTRAFKPWIIGIAIKQMYSTRRKIWKRLMLLKKVERTEILTTYDKTDELINKYSNKKIDELVNFLPYKLKQVIILQYVNEHSQEEIAKILNIPLGTVKSRISSALRKLRQKGYEDNYFFEKVRKV